MGNFEQKIWAAPFSRTPLSFGTPLSREALRIFAQILNLLKLHSFAFSLVADYLRLSLFVLSNALSKTAGKKTEFDMT